MSAGDAWCDDLALPDRSSRQASDIGKPVFYRFQKSADDRFPVMLELFCHSP
jgi:hypothetical protein